MAEEYIIGNNAQFNDSVEILKDLTLYGVVENTTDFAVKIQGDEKLRITSEGALIGDTISHIGDTDTKIRFPENDVISFETAGSERVRITSTGSVGIGTNNPDVGNTAYPVVQVHGTSTNAYFKLTNTTTGVGSGDGVELSLSGSDAYLTNRESASIIFRTGGSNERLRIDSSGRFLKGLTSAGGSRSSTSVRYPHFQLSSPWSSGLGSYKIECTDDYPIIFIDSNASYANGSGAGVITWSVKDSSGDYCNTASIRSQIDAAPSNDSAPGRLEFMTTTSGTSPTTKMTIDSGGSVSKPLNPAFYANNLANNAVYSAGTIVPWPNTTVDTRSAFATSGSDIGRYTIPTTGLYFFGWRLNRLGDSRFDYAIYVNGSIKYYDELRSDHGSGIWQAESGHYIFNCTAGQKVDMRIASVSNAGSGQFDGGQLYDAFFGWMIG